MNVFLENEKELVDSMLEEIINNAHNTPKGIFNQSNDKKLILKKDVEKYNALLRMQEIINNKFQDLKSNHEYYELAELAGIKVNSENYQYLVNPNKIYEDELESVNNRIAEIIKASKAANKYQPLIFVNNKSILLAYSDEYKALIKMQNLLNNNFANMNEIFDYMDLRVQTKLGKMDDNKYYTMIGKKPTKAYEFQKTKKSSENEIKQQSNNNFFDIPSPKENAKNNNVNNEVANKDKQKPAVIELPDLNKKQNNVKLELPQEYHEQLPTEVKSNLFSIKDNGIIDVPSDNIKELPQEEPTIKVVSKKACKWINSHKKQILIAAGIASVMVATIVALNALIPAITAMLEASQVSALSTAMVNNGALWGEAIASEQAALHGANVALASTIESITGLKSGFDVGTGIWTLGGTELTTFAASAAAKAKAAVSAVSAISSSVMLTGVSGLTLTGLGILSKNKSAAYLETRKKIRDFRNIISVLPQNMIKENLKNITNSIIQNSKLNDKEKKDLLKEVQQVVNENYQNTDYEDTVNETKRSR